MTFRNVIFTLLPVGRGRPATRQRPATIPVLVAAVLLAGCGDAPDRGDAPDATVGHAAEEYSAAIDSARAVLDSVMAAGDIPGLSVAVGIGIRNPLVRRIWIF